MRSQDAAVKREGRQLSRIPLAMIDKMAKIRRPARPSMSLFLESAALLGKVMRISMTLFPTVLLGITLALAGPPQASAELDLAYAEGGDEHKLDLYLPARKGFATIVFTYGGGWHTGSRKSVTPVGKQLQSLGYGCALVSHRLSPAHKFPAQAEDVAAAFAWVKKNIAAKGGDAGQVHLMGHSSGAHLSLLIAADPKYLSRYKLSPADVRGVIGLSTPVDVEPRKSGKGFGDALMAGKGAADFSRDPAVMKDASPIQHVSRKLPRTLLVVGDRDFPMLEGDAKAFAEKAQEAGADVSVLVAKKCDHMGTVRQVLDDRSEVMEKVLAFLKKAEK
jgi:acetyl esterase/lipase